MPEKPDAIFNPLSWTLILLILGLYFLYSWHQGNLNDQAKGKDAQLSEIVQLLNDTSTSLDASEHTVQSLHSEIAALTEHYRQQERLLLRELEIAHQGIQAVQRDIDALRAQHAGTLAAEAQKPNHVGCVPPSAILTH